MVQPKAVESVSPLTTVTSSSSRCTKSVHSLPAGGSTRGSHCSFEQHIAATHGPAQGVLQHKSHQRVSRHRPPPSCPPHQLPSWPPRSTPKACSFPLSLSAASAAAPAHRAGPQTGRLSSRAAASRAQHLLASRGWQTSSSCGLQLDGKCTELPCAHAPLCSGGREAAAGSAQ